MHLDSLDAINQAITEWSPVAQTEWHRLSIFENYYQGIHRPPYEPPTATREYQVLRERSVTNLTRLIVDTLTQRLIVDGFRPSETSIENAPQWEWWQANGLDARQKALYDEAAKHGYAGCMVMPGEPAPVMRPVSAREWWFGFDDYSDDWPFLALKQGTRTDSPFYWSSSQPDDKQVWHILDDHARYVVKASPHADPEIIEQSIHGLGVVPIVPFRSSWNLTRYPDGEIAPLMAIQDRLNQTVFDLLVAQTYSAAPQKWATGLTSMPVGPSGDPLIDVQAFAKSLWMTNDVDARFGSLPEANLKNICEAIEQALRMYGLASQTPPHYLLGDLVNLSAEALLAADTTLAKKVADRQILYGEAWEQTFRLAGAAAGDEDAANDQSAQIWWRDTEPRSIAQQVDALGKMAQMLQVPPSALWEKIPGTTGSDLMLWRTEAARAALQRARAGPQAVTGNGNTAQPAQAPGANPQAAEGRAKAIG